MLRRDISRVLFGAAVGTLSGTQLAEAQSCPPACSPVYPGDVTLYGADSTGVAAADSAISAALAANSVVYFPPGMYRVTGTIQITGNKTVLGPRGGTYAAQIARIHHDTTSAINLFECMSEEFGAVCISNLFITGGGGGRVIRSLRPQSLFENLLLEIYNGWGIELMPWPNYPSAPSWWPTWPNGSPVAGYGFGSWGTVIRNCKWVGPDADTSYRGFQIAVNGGEILLDNCTAIFGDIGFNIDQCQALTIIRPNTNRQWFNGGGRAGIRFSGPGYKQAISIHGGYIEGSANGIWVENVQALDIADTYFDSLEVDGTVIYLQNSLVKNTTIRNCHILQRRANKIAIDNNNASRTAVTNCFIDAPGASGAALRTTAAIHTLGNTIVSGLIQDTNGLVQDLAAEDVNVTLAVAGSSSPGSYPIASQQSSYTRVGRRVWLDLDITLGAGAGGGTGSLSITGLPLAKRTGTSAVGSAQLSAVTYSGYVTLGFATGATALSLFQNTSNGVTSSLPITAVGAGDRIVGSISYRI